MSIWKEEKDRIIVAMFLLLVGTILVGYGLNRSVIIYAIFGFLIQLVSLYWIYEYAEYVPTVKEYHYYLASSMVVVLFGLGAFLFIVSLGYQNWLLLFDSGIILISAYTIYWRGN